MKILLTGGLGYIGSHVAKVLHEKKLKFVILDNLSNCHYASLNRLERALDVSVEFINGDIRDKELLNLLFQKNGIYAVMHFAGLKSVAESSSAPLEYYSNNVHGALEVLAAMRANGVKRIIFSSSATVYGNPQYLPIDELHPVNPISPYGRTKLQIESMLTDLALSDPDFKALSLRYFNPVGADESGLIGENPIGAPNNLMPYISKVANGDYPSLTIYGDDYSTLDGTGVRDYIHIDDLARAHVASLAYLDKFVGHDVFNIGTGNGYSVLEVLSQYEKVCSKKISYTFASRRDGDVDSIYASPTKAEKLLQWQSKKTLKDMVESAWNYQLQLIS